MPDGVVFRQFLGVAATVFAVESLIVLMGPIEGSISSSLVTYLSPVLIGGAVGYVARGLAGLAGLVVAIPAVRVVATIVGILAAPAEGEFVVASLWTTFLAGLAGIAYLAGAAVRRSRDRRPMV